MQDNEAVIRLDEVERLQLENLALKRELLAGQMRQLGEKRAVWGAQLARRHQIELDGGGSAAGTIRWFANPQSRVSAHFVVGRSGRIVQMVPLERAAWHAGIAEMVVKGEARGNPNLCSVGIELASHGYLQRDSDGDFWWELGREMRPYRGVEPKQSTLVYDNGLKVEGWWEPYPEAQLEALEWLLGELVSRGCPNNIVGHEEIAMPLGRKRDPGPLFAWPCLKRTTDRRTRALV